MFKKKKLHLHKDVLHNLTAVIVYTYVTGEGLAEEDISVMRHGKVQLKIDIVLTHVLQIRGSYPKFCGNVSISPSIKFSAPLMVDGSSLIS